jgi:hypothetical protein
VRRKTREDRLFEGRKIDNGLNLLEMEGDELENGHHSLGIRRNLQNSNTPFRTREAPTQAREEA